MANIKQITLNGTTYNIYDSSAVHTVDAALSSSSTNPVQNKVVKAALDTKGTIIDLGTKTNTSTAGYYTFTVSSTDATALATTHDGIRILCGSGSAYRPSEYLIAFKNGTTTVNGVASTIYTGTVGNADFSSKTVAIVIPTSTSGTGYIKEGDYESVWGFSTNGAAVYPYEKAAGSSAPAGNVAVISPTLSGESIKIASGKTGNIAVAPATTTDVSSAPAGSTSYTTGDSNWALPDGTVSFMSDYYFQSADNSVAPQKPTSVVKNNDGTLTLTFASSLNPSSAVTKLYATTYIAAGGNISATNGVSITSTSNLVAGSYITTSYGTVVAGQKISNTGMVSALVGARLKNTANYSILVGSDNLNAKAYAAIFGQGHDSTNGPAAVTAVGKYSNITSTSAFVIGNGTATSARSNAFEVCTDGTAKHYKDVYIYNVTNDWTTPSKLIFPCASDREFSFKPTENGTNVDVGWDYAAKHGAGLGLRSIGFSSNPGAFSLYARNSAGTTAALNGTPAGVLTWNSRRVVTSTNSTAVGDASTPVYINTNGYPVACSLDSGFAKKENSHYYGICNTAAATAAKEVTVQYTTFDTPNLVEGTTIAVKFVNGNTAENIALSVNGLTSVFVIKRKGTSGFDTVSINMPTNAIYEFTYDGTYWDINVGALSISASAQTVPSSAESFSDNITLHKVSKTGSFSDLLNKPSATVSGLSTSKTLTALSETDGVISATAADIAIAGSQVTSGNIAAARMPTGYMKEAYLEWGGKNFSAGNGPLDAALINTLGADRFAFIPAACTTVEYSTDAGATWQDYGLSDSNKVAIFAPGLGVAVYLGKHTTAGSGTANDQLRITVDTYSGSQRVYSAIKKFVMFGSTNGAANTKWSLQVRTTANVLNNVDTWVNVFTDVAWGGWSGINIAQTDVTIGSNAPTSTSNTQYRQFRLIFKQGTPSASYASSQILYIMGYGGVGWSTPSNMAKVGSIYTYDVAQNVAFPARVKATELKGLGANYYGTCTTAAATAAKVVTCTDFVLTTGARISVKFTNGSTSTATMTLNVNGTGAKQCGVYLDNNTWQTYANRCENNEVLEFIYNGTYWITLTPYALRSYYTNDSRATSANISLANGGLQYILATSSMTTGKPPVDSHILNMNWDNTTTYAAQLAVAHGGNTSATESYAGRLFARGQRMGDGSWSGWYEFPRYSVLPSDGDIIVSEDAAGAARIKGISTLPSSKVVADDAHSMMYNGSTIMLADPTDDYKLGKGPTISLLDQASYLRHDGSWVTPPNTDTSGSIYGATIYEDGTSLTNKYAPKSHTHTLDQVYNDSTTEGRTVASGDRLLIASVGGSDSSGVVKSPSTLAFTSDTSQFLRHDGTFAEPVLSGANVTVTSTATKATNDVIPIADASDSYKLKNMSITLDTSDTATFLCHDGSWSTPYYIRTIGDQRSTGTTPNTYKNQLAFLGLKGKATINNPSTDTYSYLLGLRGWSDSSGGNAWELAFNNTGIFARTGATTTWGNWQQLMTSTNYNTWASPKSHTHTLDQVYNDSTTASRTVESGDRILIASMGGSDSSGLVKSPSALALGSDTTKFLCNNGTWAIPGNVILSYGSSTWQDFIDAYNANRIIYCRASSNTDPATGSQTRMAFMAYVDDGTTPTNVEFQYYRSVATHSNTQQGDEVYVYKLTNAGAWTVTKRQAYTKIVAGTNMSSSYSSGTLTLSATNTDTKVTQTAITGTSTTNFYPILLAKSTGQTADTTDTANFTANASVTPSGDIYSVNMVATESFKYGANAHTTYNSTLKAIEFIFD